MESRKKIAIKPFRPNPQEWPAEKTINTVLTAVKEVLQTNVDSKTPYEELYRHCYMIALYKYTEQFYEALQLILEEHCNQLVANFIHESEYSQPCEINSMELKLTLMQQQFQKVVDLITQVTMYIRVVAPEYSCDTMALGVFNRKVLQNEAVKKILQLEEQLLDR